MMKLKERYTELRADEGSSPSPAYPRVLITGGRGFIGSHTAENLQKRGYAVATYDIIDGPTGNILYPTHLELTALGFRPTWIIHLAGQVSLAPSLVNPQNDAMINIIGSLNVLECARAFKCGITFSSSGAVYGNNYQYPEPISPYAVSKLAVENYFKLYSRLYNLHTVVFRFSSVYGMGRAPTSINLIVAKALRDELIKITGDGFQTRDFTHVTDVAEALALSAEGKFPSGVYDIGTGTATSLNDLILILQRLLSKTINIEYIPESVGDPKRNELNVSKAAIYGFKAKVPIIEGLKQLIEEIKK